MATRSAVGVAHPNRPAIIGMGLVALDVVITDVRDQQPRYFSGGTCGNVLTILKYIGWTAKPIARLGLGSNTDFVVADLRKFGVSTQFVTKKPDGSTPVIIHRIRRVSNGDAYHTFSWRCPSCGAHLPGYKPVLGSITTQLSTKLGSPNVFFFDRVSRGVLNVANVLRERGTVIVFEPSSVGEPRLFREAWAVAHIVKYSNGKLRDIADIEVAPRERTGVLLEIETLGGNGVRYQSRLPRARTQGWCTMEAFSQSTVRDTAGAGDWCTAGLLDKVARSGVFELRRTTMGQLKDAVRYGQALAAWNCRFEGARGGMYELSRTEFVQEVDEILAGKVLQTPRGVVDCEGENSVGRVCPSCIGLAKRGNEHNRRRA